VSCPLQVVADLVGEVRSLHLSSELDDAVSEVPLAEFLVSSLAGLGISPAAITSVLVRLTDATRKHMHARSCTLAPMHLTYAQCMPRHQQCTRLVMRCRSAASSTNRHLRQLPKTPSSRVWSRRYRHCWIKVNRRFTAHDKAQTQQHAHDADLVRVAMNGSTLAHILLPTSSGCKQLHHPVMIAPLKDFDVAASTALQIQHRLCCCNCQGPATKAPGRLTLGCELLCACTAGGVTSALSPVLKALSGGGFSLGFGYNLDLGFINGISQLLDFKTVFKRALVDTTVLKSAC
jgi:hypothetical protein